MSADIVKRLRFMGRHASETERCAAIRRVNERNEAADLIEALRAQLPAEQPSNPAPRMGGNTIIPWQERRSEWFRRNAQKRDGPGSNDAFTLAEIADLRTELARIVGQQTKGGGNG